MYFTQEDFIKIHNWLKVNSVKDTDFIPADIPLHEGDTVAIVQDGINKQLPLAYLRQSFKLCTHEEYEALAYNREVDPEIIYGLLTHDGSTVDQIFFGYIPYAVSGAIRSFDHAENWVINTDISDYTKEVGSDDIISKVLSYKGQSLTIHYSATRTIVYKWSDDRPDTTEVEYGQVSFDITTDNKDAASIISWENLHTEDKAFKFDVNRNNTKQKIDLKITPKIYGESTKSTFIDTAHTGILVQGMAYIYMQESTNTDSTSKIITIEVQAVGYPSSDIPIIDEHSIQIVKGNDYIEDIDIIQTGGNAQTYNLKVTVKANSSNASRNIQIKINDQREDSTLSATTTIVQSGVGEVSITGIQLSNIIGYLDAAHTQPITDPIKVQYGKSKTIYLVPNEGYILPESTQDISISPSNTSFTYNKEAGTITFNALTEDVTEFKIEAYHFSYYTYSNLTITEFEYPEFGTAEEGSTTNYNKFSYRVDRIEHYINSKGQEIKKTVIGSTQGGQLLFTFTAKDSSNNTISPSSVATIDPGTGKLTWKLNSTGQNNIVTVKVRVSFTGTDSEHTKLQQEESTTIIQPYATRTVTVNTTKSKGLKLTLEGTTGNTVSVPYGQNVEITVSAKENYRVPSVSEISSHLSVTPEGGYQNYKYNISEATGKNTLQIFNITSNISVIMTGVEKTVIELPIYCGVLTPQDSGFTSKQPTSAITDTMLEDALRSGALEVVDNLPRTKDNPYIMEVTTKYSYVIGLIPTSGSYANYIIKQDSGLGALIALTYGGETGYALNGERTVNIQGNSYKLYAVYQSAKEGKKYTYKWAIFENN